VCAKVAVERDEKRRNVRSIYNSTHFYKHTYILKKGVSYMSTTSKYHFWGIYKYHRNWR